MRVTRRQMAAALVAGTAAAQTTPQPAAPADELQAARQRMKSSTESLAKVRVPIETEPAFQFKA
jgi:hypothetical protein